MQTLNQDVSKERPTSPEQGTRTIRVEEEYRRLENEERSFDCNKEKPQKRETYANYFSVAALA